MCSICSRCLGPLTLGQFLFFCSNYCSAPVLGFLRVMTVIYLYLVLLALPVYLLIYEIDEMEPSKRVAAMLDPRGNAVSDDVLGDVVI